MRTLKYVFAAPIIGALFFSDIILASSPIEGEYICNECNGFLKVKKNQNKSYNIWLGVGAGSCGGETLVNGNFTGSPNGKFLIPRKEKGKKCTTSIEINASKATILDSCIKPEDEESSTCAMLGEYQKR